MRDFCANKTLALTLLVVMIMVFSSAFAVGTLFGGQRPENSNRVVSVNSYMGGSAAFQLDHERFSPVPVAPMSVEKNISAVYNGSVSVLITFSLTNQSRLNSLLLNLSNPKSLCYHKFMTRSQFSANFSISPQLYSQAVSYLSQYPDLNVKTYADRVSIEVTGPAKEVGNLFNTSIVANSSKSSVYYADSSPELPESLAPYVSEVTGLSNIPMPLQYNMVSKQVLLSQIRATSAVSGYPSPINSGGVQYIYGSDLQVAYDEQSLLNITYPTNEVIATILWAGTNSSGTPVGAFDPSDIYAYYNATLPSYEPHAKVYGVPLNGAVKPGLSASYDATGANDENTLDLEMVGSTAPGASIYNVYGPNSTFESIDSAFAFILNPNSTYQALNNVSVITNSWGSAEFNNTVWYQYLQEAQTRGISVLASSGDSGDNTASPKYTGSTVEFPSAMAYDGFGVTAVGGDTLTLASSLHISNETAWYETSSYTGGSPTGSTGGISSVFAEPTWQLDTEANNIINGQGRGVPDISAIANNTIVYITVDGVSYYGNPSFYIFGGTSVASPVEAGIIAEINAVFKHYNQSNLGYLNPLLYSLGNSQVSPMKTTTNTGYDQTGNYNSTLPALPFYNVMYGRNHLYNATYGYNLVTGWGSVDAYNMSMYALNVNRSLSSNGLKGVEDNLSLSGLNVTSYFYNSTTGTYNIVNTAFNASIQQNLFLANQYGAPIYWIQNVVYISGSQSLGWTVDYTGWVVFPFFGQYPSQTVYEYNFPIGETISMPHTFDVKTWISNLTEPMQQSVNFEINSHIISLPVPGAAYIIDANNYTYSWQGNTYYNGPYPDNPFYGGLNPQFGLVGGPSGGLGIFGKPTGGSVSAYVEPLDMNSYIAAATNVFNESIDETGETANSLSFTNINQSTWTISVNNGSQLQGLVDSPQGQYSQVFQENGLPSGTAWSVNVSGTVYTTISNQIIVPLVNGSYTATFSMLTGFFVSPSRYIFNVEGQTTYFSVIYSYSSNETYLKPVSTIYPVNDQILPGSAFNSTYYGQNLFSFGMAYDSNTGMLFDPVYSSFTNVGAIYVYNTITDALVEVITIPSYDAVYNPSTGYVYALSSNGNISEINPSTFAIMKNLTLTDSVSNDTVLQEQGNYVYALSDNGNISQINAYTMTIVKTIEALPGGETSTFPLFFSAYDGNAYVANPTENDILIVNFTSSAITEVYLPAHYAPQSVIQYYGYDLLIGGENYSDQLYNLSTGSLTTGPYVSGVAISSVYDQISHTLFLFSSSFNLGSFGLITDVNPFTGKILATIPGVILILSPMFNPANQNIYADIAFGSVSEYSVQHYYTANFTESGLPSGTGWYVNLTNGVDSGPIIGTSYSLSLANGTYSYNIATSNKTYSPSQSSASITVNGAAVSVPLTFSKVTYLATFTESGLQSGIWYVNLSNGDHGNAFEGSPITFSLSNGSYSYSVATSNELFHPSSNTGVVDMSGNTPVSIQFVQTTYNVQFTESGLPSGTMWYVNLTNGIDSGPITGSSYSFSLVNGSYSYTVQTVNKIYSPTSSSGSFTVNGTPLSKSIVFSMVTYALTFKETGLPSGVIWYVNGSGLSGYESSEVSISFSLANGTYSFTVTNLSSYYSTTTHFTVVISGKNATEVVDYYHWAYISGTISPTNADLVINGKSVALTSSGSFNMSVPDGTYHVVISSSGYVSYYSNFTLNSGNAMNLTINLKQVSHPSTLTGIDLYIVVGAVIAVIAIGAAVVLIKRRK